MATLQLCMQSGELLMPRLQSSIRVLKGRLWLTRAGELDDQFLDPGDVAQLAPMQKPLLEAINGSVLMSVEMPDTINRI